MGHLTHECTQIGRFGLRHEIYESSPQEMKSNCHHCKEEGHPTETCTCANKGSERENEGDRYREAHKELLRKDPITFMDEATTEYPSHDYRQIDDMIEERKRFREQTPKRDLSKEKYQPRRLMEQGKIDLNLPRTA